MAHSIQNTVGFVASVLQNTQTVPMTLGSGTNRKVIACLVEDTSTIHSDITYDGVSFGTAVFSVISTATSNCKTVWYIYDVPDAKPAGTYNIVYSRNFSTTQVGLIAWQTIDSALGGPSTTASDEGTTAETILTTTISSNNGDILLAAASNTLESLDWSWSGGTVTERYEGDGIAQSIGGADAVITSTGTKTVTATISATGGNMVLGAITISPLSVPTSNVGSPANINLTSGTGVPFIISQQQIGSSVTGVQ